MPLKKTKTGVPSQGCETNHTKASANNSICPPTKYISRKYTFLQLRYETLLIMSNLISLLNKMQCANVI